jgi:hypothetical protein
MFPFIRALQVFPVSAISFARFIWKAPPRHTHPPVESERPEDCQLDVVPDVRNVTVLQIDLIWADSRQRLLEQPLFRVAAICQDIEA